uniref:Predicted protein n=1 Tax=Hordeum vulgare subsp. vulgare TaxID=112509 RepID=F2E7C2_HORVV|nr:predicted protein [Hordeum vulgare subsp. vulgare]
MASYEKPQPQPPANAAPYYAYPAPQQPAYYAPPPPPPPAPALVPEGEERRFVHRQG